MLLQEKIKNTSFSPSEQQVIDFILEKQHLIEDYSTTSIAGETYTSPSILIRISKKLGYNGFIEFKKAFLEEVIYLQKNFQNIDANYPFDSTDSIMAIANKIALVKQESLNDTLSLIHHDTLQKSIRLMQTHSCIKVFSVSNLSFIAEEFVHKLRRIGKRAETFSISNSMIQESLMCENGHLAICISYSGESGEIIEVSEILKSKNIPIIAVTSIGDNTLSHLSDVTLHVTTREKAYSKIAGFSSQESIHFIMDVLYSCYFGTNYNQHLDYKITLASKTEERRITNSIIQEEQI